MPTKKWQSCEKIIWGMPNGRWSGFKATNRRKRKTEKESRNKREKTIGTKKESAAAEESTSSKKGKNACTEKENGTKKNISNNKKEQRRIRSDIGEIPSFTTGSFIRDCKIGSFIWKHDHCKLSRGRVQCIWQLYTMRIYTLEKWCYQLLQLLWPSSTCMHVLGSNWFSWPERKDDILQTGWCDILYKLQSIIPTTARHGDWIRKT